MSWREIKTADVLGYFTPAEQGALKNILNQADTLSLKISDGVGMVRGFVAAGQNAVDSASLVSIPDQLRPATIAFVAWEWLSSFPALKAFKTKEREDRANNAQKLFERIGSQETNRPRVEQPAAILQQAAPTGGVEVARKQKRKATAHKLSGLI